MKQATEALRNPVHVRDVIRSTDRSMSQLEGLGTGSFDVLRQMCDDIGRPLQDEEYVRQLAAVEAQKKEQAKLEKLKKQRAKEEGDEDEDDDDEEKPEREEGEEGDGDEEKEKADEEEEEEDEDGPKCPEWVGQFDTNAMASMMQDQNMQSLLAQLVQALPGPGLKVHPDDPFLDPGFIGQMFHGQSIDSMTKLQESVEKLSMTDGGEKGAPKAAPKKGSKDAKEDGPAHDSSAALSGLHFKSPAHNFKEGFAMFLAAEQESPEVRYKGQLQAMRNMGFLDKEACIQALHNCDGNMNKAVELLMAEKGDK